MNVARTVGVVVGAGMVVSAVVGCTTTAGGSPAPAASTAHSSGAKQPRLAPPITGAPVDLSSIASQPCSALSDAYLTQLGVALPGTPSATGDFELGPECAWTESNPDGPRLTVRDNNTTGGLEGLYQRRSSFSTFEPMTVAGYPAVNAQALEGGSSCFLNVGVNETDILAVELVPTYGTPDYQQPCATAAEIATQIIQKLAG